MDSASWSTSDRMYFANLKTRETQWEAPSCTYDDKKLESMISRNWKGNMISRVQDIDLKIFVWYSDTIN